MNAFLNNLNQLIATQCPFLVVPNYGGAYYKSLEEDFQVEFGPDSGLPPSPIQQGVLKSKKFLILNGGSQSLTPALLAGQQHALLAFTVAGISYHLNLEASTNTSVKKITFNKPAFDTQLAAISIHSTLDTRIVVSARRMLTFRPQVAPSITMWPQSNIICTRQLYDFTFPIVMPGGSQSNDVTIFLYNSSFVVSQLEFTINNNQLYFEFMYDLQSPNGVEIFN